MTITKQKNAPATRPRILLFSLGLLLIGAVLLLLFVYLGQPPQMGANEEVFRTVDALFTAVTARDVKQLADCEQRLLTLKDAGKLPPEASVYLDNIIRKARAGDWESAARTLYDFMKVQRREGSRDPQPARRTNAAKDGYKFRKKDAFVAGER